VASSKPKPKAKIDLSEAVKRMDRSIKRETGTPPKPFDSAPRKPIGKASIPISRKSPKAVVLLAVTGGFRQ
jgi:hypothetical protein